jgi:hypothetical protein
MQRAIEAHSPAVEVDILYLNKSVHGIQGVVVCGATLLTRILSIAAG